MQNAKDFMVTKTKAKQKKMVSPIRKLRIFCGYTSTIIEKGKVKTPGTPNIQ